MTLINTVDTTTTLSVLEAEFQLIDAQDKLNVVSNVGDEAIVKVVDSGSGNWYQEFNVHCQHWITFRATSKFTISHSEFDKFLIELNKLNSRNLFGSYALKPSNHSSSFDLVFTDTLLVCRSNPTPDLIVDFLATSLCRLKKQI